MNRNQNLLGKVMIVLTRECDDVRLVQPGEWAELHREIVRVTSALDELFRPDRYNLSFLMNVDSRVHLHVFPRYAEAQAWDGEVFEDPHFGDAARSDQRILPSERLAALADAIRGCLPDRAQRT